MHIYGGTNRSSIQRRINSGSVESEGSLGSGEHNSNSKLTRVQKELDNDAIMIQNRMGKLRQIEHKMLKKIDKTRIEAERCRVIKE